jgi:phosphatidylserine decarboxylase
VAPADGKIMVRARRNPACPRRLADQHLPLARRRAHQPHSILGHGERVEYPRQVPAAYQPESAAQNERNELWIRRGERLVVARQLSASSPGGSSAGSPGTAVLAGDRFGLMKFGSRMDVFVPPGVAIAVKVGDRVVGGETVLARWPAGR